MLPLLAQAKGGKGKERTGYRRERTWQRLHALCVPHLGEMLPEAGLPSACLCSSGSVSDMKQLLLSCGCSFACHNAAGLALQCAFNSSVKREMYTICRDKNSSHLGVRWLDSWSGSSTVSLDTQLLLASAYLSLHKDSLQIFYLP